MLTLIAESKTMSSAQEIVSESLYKSHIPFFENEANAIMEKLRALPTVELEERIGVSRSLASKSAMLIYDFPNKSLGLPTFKAFTGEVFRSIDIKTLSESDIAFASRHLMIVSSLYGLLFTDDIIKPYRLDYGADCAPGGEALFKFWKPKLTVRLVKLIQSLNETEILNLLPADAAKCIDWKLVKRFAKVDTPLFKKVCDNGSLQTPSSGKIKELRGSMVRSIITKGIDTLKQVSLLSNASFMASSEHCRPGSPLFLMAD